MNTTIERTMQILQFIGGKKEGISLQEIVNEFGMPKSSAHVILKSLSELNYITPSRYNNKKYCLGVEVFSLGMKYVDELDFVKQCSVYLNPLAEKYNKTAFIGVLRGTNIVYVGKYVAKNAVLASCSLGSRKNVYSTANGKAILAFLPKEELEMKLNQIKFEAITEKTITSKEKLRAELELIRQRGYSIEIMENEKISTCCGAPIFDFTGRVVAGVSLSDIYNSKSDDIKVAEELRDTARQISISMGYKE